MQTRQEATRVTDQPDFEGESCHNSFGVPDWLIEPIYRFALSGLEFLDKRDVPPRLVPLVGRRVRKLRPSQRDDVLKALGAHRRFTELVLTNFARCCQDVMEQYEGRGAAEIFEDADHLAVAPEEAVSVLIAAGRTEDARHIAQLLYSDPEPDETSEQESAAFELAVDALATARELEGSQQDLQRDLKKQTRARKRADKKIESLTRHVSALQTQLRDERVKTANATRIAEQTSKHAEQLASTAEFQKTEIDGLRRKLRDAVSELGDVQGRLHRLRRELRRTRARLPKPAMRSVVRIADDSAPTLAELRRACAAEGPRGVFETKGVKLVVDGYNVGLGHIAAPKLEATRSRLEQALESYAARTKNRVLVVYDGKRVSWFWVPVAAKRVIERVFTAEAETADDYIVDELEEMDDTCTPVVVTSDRELSRRCSAAGAFVVRSEDLAAYLGLGSGARRNAHSTPEGLVEDFARNSDLQDPRQPPPSAGRVVTVPDPE